VSDSTNKGRPAPRRRPASFRNRLVGWVNRITPWFAVALLILVAVWFAFAAYTAIDIMVGASRSTTALWTKTALYVSALAGAACFAFVGVRVASPSRLSDGAVRVFATLGLLLSAFTAPMIILRNEYGAIGMLIAVTPLAVYYLRLRRPLVAILPMWCGGTYKPDDKRRSARGEEVIKRPPRSWDEPSSAGTTRRTAGRGAPAQGAPGRRKSKKKRRSGR
jgi:hypothetical protein